MRMMKSISLAGALAASVGLQATMANAQEVKPTLPSLQAFVDDLLADPTSNRVVRTEYGIVRSYTFILPQDSFLGRGAAEEVTVWGNEATIIGTDQIQLVSLDVPSMGTDFAVGNTPGSAGITGYIWGNDTLVALDKGENAVDYHIQRFGSGWVDLATQDHDVKAQGIHATNQGYLPSIYTNGPVNTTTNYLVNEGGVTGVQTYGSALGVGVIAGASNVAASGDPGALAIVGHGGSGTVAGGSASANRVYFDLNTLNYTRILSIDTDSGYGGKLVDVDLLPHTNIPLGWALPGALDFVGGGPLAPGVDVLDTIAGASPISGGEAGRSVLYRLIGDRSAAE